MKGQRKHVKDVLGDLRKARTTTAAPEAPADAGERRKPGRPRGPLPSSKVTVVLYDRQINALDDLCHAMYGHDRTKVTRTDIVRGVLDAILFSEGAVKLDDAKNEDEICQRIAARLKKS